MRTNFLLNTDSYKVSMPMQYPPGTETIYSYIEARNSDLSNEVVFFGLQAFIKEYLQTPITKQDIDEAEELWTAHGEPFNREMWEHIVLKHDGYMPVRIQALPEGTIVPLSTVMLTIENTDPKCFALTTYLETALLRAIWYPSSVATNSREMKKIIRKHMIVSSDYDE